MYVSVYIMKKTVIVLMKYNANEIKIYRIYVYIYDNKLNFVFRHNKNKRTSIRQRTLEHTKKFNDGKIARGREKEFFPRVVIVAKNILLFFGIPLFENHFCDTLNYLIIIKSTIIVREFHLKNIINTYLVYQIHI